MLTDRTRTIAADSAELERVKRVSRYVGIPRLKLPGDLYSFCVDVLGYDALSESFHGPLLKAWDKVDLLRFRQYEGHVAIDESAVDTLDLWPRGHIKTWCQRARVLRYFLWNPAATVTWWHAVEAKAFESGEAVAEQLLKNTKLRSLFPQGVLPAPNASKFFSGGKMTLKGGRKIGDGPSLVCMGAGGEATGGHSLVAVLDDFVGLNDVLDSQMPKKKQFYQSSVRNVVMRTNAVRGWVDCIGTHWSIDDPYVDWRRSDDWICTVRAALETDGAPDLNGTPVYLTKPQIEKERREQGEMSFMFQMMNDPSPRTEKPWYAEECERYCKLSDAAGAGYVVALSDPAPRAIGSVGGRDERWRRDGTKNYWSHAVVKLRRVGDQRQIILLDGEESRDWGLDEGMCRLVELASKWHAREVYAESTSTPVYKEALVRAVRENHLGWKGHVIGSSGRAEDKFKNTYNSQAKNAYFIALCDRAKVGELLIAESVPEKFRESFIRQARGWMPLPDGRTGIPFDDAANVVSFATDPYFTSKYPSVDKVFHKHPLDDDEEMVTSLNRTRYCHV